MKEVKFSRKLNLNKKVIANLTKNDLKNIVGGSTPTDAVRCEGGTDTGLICAPNTATRPGVCHMGTLQNETACSVAYQGTRCTSGSECGLGNWPV